MYRVHIFQRGDLFAPKMLELQQNGLLNLHFRGIRDAGTDFTPWILVVRVGRCADMHRYLDSSWSLMFAF